MPPLRRGGPPLPGGLGGSGVGAPGGSPLPPPLVTAIFASGASGGSATLTGSINPQGLAGSWWFVWGTSPSFSNTTPPSPVGATVVPQTVSTVIVGLTTGTLYYFALVGSTAGGTVTSNSVTFTPTNPNPVTNASNPLQPTSTPAVTIPHLAFPFSLSPTLGAAVVQQDTLEEVFDCVQVIAACPVGACPELPEFGIPDLAFAQTPIDPRDLTNAIQALEPRAKETAIAELLDSGGTTSIQLTTQMGGGGK